MNKNIFISILSISLLSLSSCVTMPEKEIGIDPIFTEEDNGENNKTETQTGEIISEENTEETVSTGEIIESENEVKIKTSTGEIIEDEIKIEENLELEGESEIISETENNSTETQTGEIISAENTEENTSTGEIIETEVENSTGENL